ncbi:MAG: hypothetical protein JW801_16010 [Bacteroidales bacterium]|nr:hypothetical protein [Bacteroidales bacterium]
MDRRKFIKLTNTGAMATLALGGFSKILNAQDDSNTSSPMLYSYFNIISDSDKTGQYEFFLTLYKAAVESFTTAADEYKAVTIKTKYYISKSAESTYETRQSEAKYIMQSCELVDAEAKKYLVLIEYQENVTGSYDMPADFLKKIYLHVFIKDNYVILYDKNGQIYKQLESWDDFYYDYYYYYDYLEDCFLTSACTRSRNLPDDCHELETLRSFRDNYMKNSERGSKLIEEYYEMGPSIVFNINEHPKKQALWDYLFTSLVSTSVVLIEEGKMEEAMDYYAEYVRGLNVLLKPGDENLNEW